MLGNTMTLHCARCGCKTYPDPQGYYCNECEYHDAIEDLIEEEDVF